MNVYCPYCNNLADFTHGDEVYPHRKDLSGKPFWICRDCNAYCGCHKGTDRPLGTLANKELRHWRKQAHSFFDPLWMHGKLSRGDAYGLLAKDLGIPKNECHIGSFSADQCRGVVAFAKRYKSDNDWRR